MRAKTSHCALFALTAPQWLVARTSAEYAMPAMSAETVPTVRQLFVYSVSSRSRMVSSFTFVRFSRAALSAYSMLLGRPVDIQGGYYAVLRAQCDVIRPRSASRRRLCCLPVAPLLCDSEKDEVCVHPAHPANHHRLSIPFGAPSKATRAGGLLHTALCRVPRSLVTRDAEDALLVWSGVECGDA